VSLQPVFTLKVPVWGNTRRYHQYNSQGVTKRPRQLRHKAEVHTVNTRYQGWRKKHNCGDGKDLDNFVLLDANPSRGGIQAMIMYSPRLFHPWLPVNGSGVLKKSKKK
jgi:hypothetical protein